MRSGNEWTMKPSLDDYGNVEGLSRILGHTNITTTFNRYIKTRQDDLDATGNAIEKGQKSAGVGLRGGRFQDYPCQRGVV